MGAILQINMLVKNTESKRIEKASTSLTLPILLSSLDIQMWVEGVLCFGKVLQENLDPGKGHQIRSHF